MFKPLIILATCYILIVQSIITVIPVKELIVNKVYKDKKSEKDIK